MFTVLIIAAFIPVLLIFFCELSGSLLAAWFWTGTGVDFPCLPLLRLTAGILICMLAVKMQEHFFSCKLRLFQLKGCFKAFLLILPVTLSAAFINLLNLAGKSFSLTFPADFFSCFFQAAYPALLEETAFRGLIIPLLIKKWGRLRHYKFFTVTVCAGIFGLFHLFNLRNGTSLSSVILQVCYAACIGCVFAAVFLRTRSLAGGILSHTLINFTAYLNGTVTTALESSPAAVIITLLLCSGCLLWTAFLLKKDHREAIDPLWSDLRSF